MPRTALIIDPSPAARKTFARLLASLNLFDDLLFSGDRPETETQLGRHPIEMIFCGWRPETVETLRELLRALEENETWSDIPVFALADKEQLSEKILALEHGAADYQSFRADKRELEARIRRQLRQQERTRKLRQEKDLLAKLARTDALTGLHNRAQLDTSLEIELSRTRRTRNPLSLLMIDLDHFKHINDTYGHAVGDRVLRAVAESLGQITRCSDLVCRYGGEEFAVILPDTTSANAYAVAEKIRLSLMALNLREGQATIPVTASIGISGTRPEGLTQAAELLREADQALYLSKQRGRNRTELFRPLRPAKPGKPLRPYLAYPRSAVAFA
ncbi:GGDEF domain-containing response regulator [Trichloromonas sp.]|uniref:GGDEF domain-containing response regulator n=1 Tax=Trichloromonas sp. TaxID=3069249 RepID=UPI002A3E40E4|nr:diguanylate cyclase [Trichloromonas sp.]